MNISKINNNLSFKGYNNIISYSTSPNVDDHFAYMAMQLNNEGEKDLEKWQDFQRKFAPNQEPSDYLYMHSVSLGGKNHFIIDDISIDMYNYNTNECVKYAPELEKTLLKIQKFLASLTRRIYVDEFPPEDRFIYKNLAQTLEKLSIYVNGKDAAETLATAGATKQVKHRVTAKLINRSIDKNMKKFFHVL